MFSCRTSNIANDIEISRQVVINVLQDNKASKFSEFPEQVMELKAGKELYFLELRMKKDVSKSILDITYA